VRLDRSTALVVRGIFTIVKALEEGVAFFEERLCFVGECLAHEGAELCYRPFKYGKVWYCSLFAVDVQGYMVFVVGVWLAVTVDKVVHLAPYAARGVELNAPVHDFPQCLQPGVNVRPGGVQTPSSMRSA